MASSRESLPVPIVVAGALLLVISTGIFFWYRQRQNTPRDVPILTKEAAAYLPNLQLADVDMQAAENYLNQTTTTISGRITNAGPRTLRLVEINCIFKDQIGQAVLRERVAIVGRKTGPVPTGQTRPFELNFDNIPVSWNQAMPDLVISQIIFQE